MACPVCFGDSNEPMAIATNYGIWFMLGIVAVMLSAFATFFLYLRRRANAAEAQDNAPAEAGNFVRGQEGTA
jgi:hypothetical protein